MSLLQERFSGAWTFGYGVTTFAVAAYFGFVVVRDYLQVRGC